ncbi:MAG: GAF domain-containing protein [Planctomycetes bacterium]|nr:GAF domain-containing protein [Planctomycetota bacterium]
MTRPYDKLVGTMKTLTGDRTALMREVVDGLWDALHTAGVSWVGFYLFEDGDELVLGPSRDKPACSPIGLHGACGQAFKRREPLIVRDVREFGEAYIACDPRDRSEVIVPVFDDSGACWGVLDLDSYDVGSFDQSDVEGLRRVLQAAGLSPP